MLDWNGRDIKIAESSGGVLATANPFDNLVRTGISPWPPWEVVQKLYQSRQIRAYSGPERITATSHLGFYSDLQSLHSEDAITWSVFGTIGRAPEKTRVTWLREFFSLLGSDSRAGDGGQVSLWRRLPHPDTLVSGGPEIDFAILTADVVVLGEAKWRSSVARDQGKARNKTQVDLRREFLNNYWQRMAPACGKRVVVLVGREASSRPPSHPSTSVPVQALTWQQVCDLDAHPLRQELMRYLAWKTKHSEPG